MDKSSEKPKRSPAASGSDGPLDSIDLSPILARLDDLEARNARLEAQNARLEAQVTKLSAENARLSTENARLSIENTELLKVNRRLDKSNKTLKQNLDKAEAKIKRLEDSLERAWRSIPRSERGDGGSGTDGAGGSGGGDSGSGDGGGDQYCHHFRQIYEGLCTAKNPGLDYKNMARAQMLSVRDYWTSLASEARFLPPEENLMGSNVARVVQDEITLRFSTEERQRIFCKASGLHSSFDMTQHFDLDIMIRQVSVRHETLRDESQISQQDRALTARKSGAFVVPKSQISTKTLINLILLHCEYKLPTRRLERMLPPGIFTASNMGRWISHAANHVQPIYLHLADQLGKSCDYLRTDDTNTHVLALIKALESGQLKADSQVRPEEWEQFFAASEVYAQKQCQPDLVAKIIKRLGRVAEYANGDGHKTKVNMTLISGKSVEDDWRSTICFMRTHCGQAGNLISRIYEKFLKPGPKRRLFIQCDCSAQNHVEKKLASFFDVYYPGCSDHARRPFKRYAAEDENLAYFFLIQFLELYNLEREIKCGPLTEDRILTIRQRGWPYWKTLLAASQTIVASKKDPVIKNRIHRSHSNLYAGCRYIINNYEALTLYLQHAPLQQTNGFSERKLRPEKLFINSSKFSLSELGSTTKDIHQTLIATTLATGQDPAAYYAWALGSDADKIDATPSAFTPYAFALQQTGQQSPKTHGSTQSVPTLLH